MADDLISAALDLYHGDEREAAASMTLVRADRGNPVTDRVLAAARSLNFHTRLDVYRTVPALPASTAALPAGGIRAAHHRRHPRRQRVVRQRADT